MNEPKRLRSGWTRFDGDVSPGDSIAVPLTVVELDEDDDHACDFCSSEAHAHLIAERGEIPADYALESTYGTVFGHTCHICVADAPLYDHMGETDE